VFRCQPRARRRERTRSSAIGDSPDGRGAFRSVYAIVFNFLIVGIPRGRYNQDSRQSQGRKDAMKADRVLVPLDGSPLAERALPVAIGLLSERPGATLILMRTTETMATPGGDLSDAQVRVIGDAHAYLKALADRLRDEGLSRTVATSVWYSGAAHAIVEAARTRRANLIVMSRGLGSALRRAMLGSVAEAVLRSTRTPVLLVPADHVPDLPRARTAAGETARARARAAAGA
jgi:nucleotide-binding universal stress UspA family protein